MLQPASFFIGLRYSRGKSLSGFVSFITFFSTAGILLGVASLITVVSVMNGFEAELKNRILSIVPHVIVEADQNQDIDIETLKANEQVSKVTRFNELEGLVQSTTQLQGVLIHSLDTEVGVKAEDSQQQHKLNQHKIVQHLVIGDLEQFQTTPYQAMLGSALARKLNVGVGDKIRLVLPNKTLFTPMGRIPMQRTFVVAALFNMGSQVDDTVVYVRHADAIKLARQKQPTPKYRIYLHDAFAAQDIVPKWQQQFPNATFTSWVESQGALFSAVRMEKNMMWLMLSLIVAVAAFNIVSALVLVVNDKQGEIGILRTIGMSSGGIMQVFVTQGMINGCWGTLFGTLLGLVLTFGLNPIMAALGINIFGAGYASQQLPILVQYQDILFIVISAFVMTLIATLYPAYRAAQTQPAEVLRNE